MEQGTKETKEIKEFENLDTSPKTNKPSYVYLLECTDKATYVGATVDPNRRLRQHNKEITGGAHLTGSKVMKGEAWERICYVEGFPEWTEALKFEWRWKQLSRKLPMKMLPVERRLRALKMLLALERSTTKAVAFSEWASPPVIHWDNTEAKRFYES